MPPGPAAPCSLAGLLAVFRPCFTAPTFPTFAGLVVGLIAQTRRRTVCGMLTGAGLDRVWHHSRAHRLFTNARWSGDALGLVLADLIVARLLPADSALTIAVDDTLFKRSGKKVFGVSWHHDGAAKGPKPIGFGNCRGNHRRGRSGTGTRRVKHVDTDVVATVGKVTAATANTPGVGGGAVDAASSIRVRSRSTSRSGGCPRGSRARRPC
jgi:hypothetical protein